MVLRSMGFTLALLTTLTFATPDTIYVQVPAPKRDTVYVVQRPAPANTVQQKSAEAPVYMTVGTPTPTPATYQSQEYMTLQERKKMRRASLIDNPRFFMYYYPITLIGATSVGFVSIYVTLEFPLSNAVSIIATPSLWVWDNGDAWDDERDQVNRFGVAAGVRKYLNNQIHRGFFIQSTIGIYRGHSQSSSDYGYYDDEYSYDEEGNFSKIDVLGYMGTVIKWSHFALSFEAGLGFAFWSTSGDFAKEDNHLRTDFLYQGDEAADNLVLDAGFSLGIGL